MNRRRAITGLVGICILGLGFRAFGFKLTVGNLIGVRIKRMALVDYQTMQAFDISGNPLSMNDPLVDNGNSKCQFFPSTNRQLNVEIFGAKETRIRYGDGPWQTGSQIDQKTVFPFPVNHGKSSVPYEIQVATDDWRQVDTWSGRTTDGNYRVAADGNQASLEVQRLRTYTRDLEHSEFRLSVDSSLKTKNNTVDRMCGNLDDRIAYFLNGKKETIRNVRLYERSFRTFRTGYLAFGASGSPDTIARPNHTFRVVSIMKRDPRNVMQFLKWDSGGHPLEQEFFDDSHISYEGIRKGRQVSVQVEAGEISPDSSISVKKNLSFESMSWDRRSFLDGGKVGYNLEVVADSSAKTIDLTVGIASDKFTEIARLPKPLESEDKPVSQGVAVILPGYRIPHGEKVQFSVTTKIPDEFIDQELRVTYIGSDGLEHGTGVSGVVPGYATMIFEEPMVRLDEIRGLIIRARKYHWQTFKNIHLYPN